MADPNPTGGGPTVCLSIPPSNKDFLRRVLEAASSGIREDLKHPDSALRRSRTDLLLEDAAYANALEALDGGPIIPTAEIRASLATLAESVDRDNEYARVVYEHQALHDLLRQLDPRDAS
ncbi:MAG: hypothetical protein R2725_11875 [Solirubrobacterales bacterium]